MRRLFALAAILAVCATPAFAGAAPSPQPSAPATAAAATQLTDDEIRALLVGNAYTVDGREGMQLTIDVHPDGTLHGYVSAGLPAAGRYSGGSSRAEDDGKYTIGKGWFCWTWGGAWANKTGKQTCAHVTKSDAGYVIGTSRMTVTPGKH